MNYLKTRTKMQYIIKRSIFKELEEHLSQKEITFLIGPRQSGKTTLLLLLKESLEKKKKKTVFFNLDIESDKQFFISQEMLLRKIRLEIGSSGYVFIDEIQRKENAGTFLKGLYDMQLTYKFIVSGSGSVELKERIHESLVGRKRVFTLTTLSFTEFVNFRTGYKYENKISKFFYVETSQAEAFLEEYLNFGGYPRVVLAETEKEKKRTMDEIYQSYLEKDVSYLLGVQKEESFTNLVRLLASQTGSPANYSELSSTLGASAKTVKNYLWYLQKTFILQKVTPFFRNARKELTKSPAFYFTDLGLRNYAATEFGRIRGLQEAGALFQNFVLLILLEKTALSTTSLNFWRTKDGAEVDFVLNYGNTIVPIEVKCSRLRGPRVEKSLQSFIRRYFPKKAYVINLSLKREAQVGKTKVRFIPYYKAFFTPFSYL